jgi:hypothetical protein
MTLVRVFLTVEAQYFLSEKGQRIQRMSAILSIATGKKGEIEKRKELNCRELTVFLNTTSVILMNRKKNVLYED